MIDNRLPHVRDRFGTRQKPQKIIISMFPRAQASLPIKKARKYSTTWMTSMLFLGRRTRRMRPPSSSDPFNTRIIPPTDTTGFGSARHTTAIDVFIQPPAATGSQSRTGPCCGAEAPIRQLGLCYNLPPSTMFILTRIAALKDVIVCKRRNSEHMRRLA